MYVQVRICHLLQSIISASEGAKEITVPPAFFAGGSWNLAQAEINMEDLLPQTGTRDVSELSGLGDIWPLLLDERSCETSAGPAVSPSAATSHGARECQQLLTRFHTKGYEGIQIATLLGKLQRKLGEKNSNGDVTELYKSRKAESKAELFSRNPVTSAIGPLDKTSRRLV